MTEFDDGQGNITCTPDPATDWTPHPVFFGGLPGDADASVDFISFADLFNFLTKTLGDSARSAVVRLKGVGSGFSTTLYGMVPGGEVPIAITIDKFEANLVQAVYGVLDVATALPTIWIWGDVDTFISDNSARDPLTGEFIDDGGGVNDISNAELVDFFKNGNDGIFGNGDEPLRQNPAGVTRLKNALGDLLGAVQGVLLRVASGYQGAAGDPLAGHIVTMDWMFDAYTDQPKVIAYSARSMAQVVSQLRATINGVPTVNVYAPVAKIKDFDTCPAVAGIPDPLDLEPKNVVTAWPETDSTKLTGVYTLDASAGHDQVDSADLTQEADGGYYVKFTLTEPSDVSIYTVGSEADTSGELAYISGRSAILNAWDADEDSGAYGNFGMSVDAAYMNGTDLPDFSLGPVQYWVRIRDVAAAPTPFTVHLQVVADGQAWPAAEPIFLKGGGGRNFTAKTYLLGTGRVNLGNALTLASRFWDLSKRDTLAFVDDPQTPEVESDPSLMFANSTIRDSITSVFPDADFTGSALEAGGDSDPFSSTFMLDFDPGFMAYGLTDFGPPPVAPGFGNDLVFCAYPGEFGSMHQIAGGYSLLPF